MIKRIITIFLICLANSKSFAQQPGIYRFMSALYASIDSHYGREAMYTDPFAYKLYNNYNSIPSVGAPFDKNADSTKSVWKAVVADTAGRLFDRSGGRERRMRGQGYFYFTYTADRARTALLNVQGGSQLYFNSEPHTVDVYNSGWLYIPVQLKKGLNEIYVRGAFITAMLKFTEKPVFINTEDPTMPDRVLNQSPDTLQGAVVVINTSSKELKDLRIQTVLEGIRVVSAIPAIPAMSSRKVPFRFSVKNIHDKGTFTCKLVLMNTKTTLDENTVPVDAVSAGDKYRNTFTSKIDGSLQYYAVAPSLSAGTNQALFLSVHGAGVEAIGQARAYQSKSWGNLVAPTNRRPRGFNWEDWGRIDALEVLEKATQLFKPDPRRIYLTGHSMGGHGTWFLGATYPDKWAAIAPCSGYPTLKGYGSADGLIPETGLSETESMLLRAGNQSDVIKLAGNYKTLGIYVLHGDADKVVSVNYARQMRKVLGEFHTDMSYYEYPGGEHWFGNQSVDWKPIYDYFSWHSLPVDSSANTISFITSNPGISASFHWAAIYQQEHPLSYSNFQLTRNKKEAAISGTTSNVRLMKIQLGEWESGTPVHIRLDSSSDLTYITQGNKDSVFLLNESGKWKISGVPDVFQKGPERYGTFKDAFRNNMVLVYGTGGNAEENQWSFNKARFDAETWYYRGNGAVDIVADKNFSLEKYAGRGVIIYGNRNTNKAWEMLLADCPIQVERNKVTAGNKVWTGDSLSAYFVWPAKNSSTTSIAAITGSGIKGMKAANANQYFSGASGFPDFMVFGCDMLIKGTGGVKLAGFFDNDWKLTPAEMTEKND